ncbi:50S ribosome-binding protein YggL [Victivallis sp. Marseille-Q1083]|uniref:50S ribosome-binding protein YggL n=1 Tax=Victivallis sp. Marseille-Q1083 TaxID=2717288 RepID=UPI00158CE373|nr:50S ribosome-binding protein YggL [Victivallis sp. Marseille-Q1083]
MKKRLRKKLRVGEFKELCFEFSGKLTEMDDAASDAFIDKFVELVEHCQLCCHGVFGDGEIELCMETGPVDTDNAERRQAFLDGLKELPQITSFEATELA